MTLEQLLALLLNARLGGVRKALARLNLSHPAISTRIATLEANPRQTLFERRPGSMTLTRQGQILLTYGEQTLFVEEEIRKWVADP